MINYMIFSWEVFLLQGKTPVSIRVKIVLRVIDKVRNLENENRSGSVGVLDEHV